MIQFIPRSLLAFLVAFGVVLIAAGIYLGIQELTSFGWLLFGIFGFFLICFLIITILRNIRKL